MLVQIQIKRNPRKPGFVYAEARDAESGELLINATADYVLQAAAERGWTLTAAE